MKWMGRAGKQDNSRMSGHADDNHRQLKNLKGLGGCSGQCQYLEDGSGVGKWVRRNGWNHRDYPQRDCQPGFWGHLSWDQNVDKELRIRSGFESPPKETCWDFREKDVEARVGRQVSPECKLAPHEWKTHGLKVTTGTAMVWMSGFRIMWEGLFSH